MVQKYERLKFLIVYLCFWSSGMWFHSLLQGNHILISSTLTMETSGSCMSWHLPTKLHGTTSQSNAILRYKACATKTCTHNIQGIYCGVISAGSYTAIIWRASITHSCKCCHGACSPQVHEKVSVQCHGGYPSQVLPLFVQVRIRNQFCHIWTILWQACLGRCNTRVRLILRATCFYYSREGYMKYTGGITWNAFHQICQLVQEWFSDDMENTERL